MLGVTVKYSSTCGGQKKPNFFSDLEAKLVPYFGKYGGKHFGK